MRTPKALLKGSGTEVIANPTLVGDESALSGLEVAGTKYKVVAGETVNFDKNILSEDNLVFEDDGRGDYFAYASNFITALEDLFPELERWKNLIDISVTTQSSNFLPQDYRFTVLFKDGTSKTCCSAQAKDRLTPSFSYEDLQYTKYDWSHNYGYKGYTFESTGETSGEIYFEFDNDDTLTLPMSIETDPETGDSRIAFGEFYIPNLSLAESIDKFIFWTPSCNTHWENPVLKDTLLITDEVDPITGTNPGLERLQDALEYLSNRFNVETPYPVNIEFKVKGITFNDLQSVIESTIDPEAMQHIIDGSFTGTCGMVFDLCGCTVLGEHIMNTQQPISIEISIATDPETGDSSTVVNSLGDYVTANTRLFGSIYLFASSDS